MDINNCTVHVRKCLYSQTKSFNILPYEKEKRKKKLYFTMFKTVADQNITDASRNGNLLLFRNENVIKPIITRMILQV